MRRPHFRRPRAQGAQEVYEMLLGQWQPNFTEKDTGEEAADYFMGFVAIVPPEID